MHGRRCSSDSRAVPFLRYACLLLAVLGVFLAGDIQAQNIDDKKKEVVDFFRSVEDSFREKNVPEIIRHVHKDLSYIMTYSTDESFSFLESDFEKYRVNVGSFFKSKPEIHEYSIIVDDIQISGDGFMVLARLKSVVQLTGIINSCDASANYLIQKVKNEYLIREVRGDATCINTMVN